MRIGNEQATAAHRRHYVATQIQSINLRRTMWLRAVRQRRFNEQQPTIGREVSDKPLQKVVQVCGTSHGHDRHDGVKVNVSVSGKQIGSVANSATSVGVQLCRSVSNGALGVGE